MTATWTTPRTARKTHPCSGTCAAYIRPGDRYLEHRAAPGGELGYEGWVRMAECADCARTYGRPITTSTED